MKITRILSIIAILSVSFNSLFALSELESAQTLASQGIIKSGNTSADFELNKTITRKEMMKVIMNLSGKNITDECNGKFGDVTHDWGCKYIETALSHDFVAANTNFRPNDSISKAESMKLILKAKGIDKAYNTSDWQADYMNTAFDTGLIPSRYSDHTSPALRGWIFQVAASDQQKQPSGSIDSRDPNLVP